MNKAHASIAELVWDVNHRKIGAYLILMVDFRLGLHLAGRTLADVLVQASAITQGAL